MQKYYERPSGFTKAMNALFGWVAARGIGPGNTVEIEIRGRSSGLPRKVPVNLVELDGKRYLVAPRGETEWVRNVRADKGLATFHRGKAENVFLTEMPEGERAPIIQKYLGENAMATKASFGIGPDAPMEEFQRIAGNHPVFLVEPR